MMRQVKGRLDDGQPLYFAAAKMKEEEEEKKRIEEEKKQKQQIDDVKKRGQRKKSPECKPRKLISYEETGRGWKKGLKRKD